MSIRARLLLFIALATLVPGILGGMRFFEERQNAVEVATAALISAANAVAEDFDKRIQGTVQLHFGLSRARDLDTRDRAACSEFLSVVRETYPQYTGILTIDPDGALFCDSIRTGRDLDLRDRAYFVEASVSTGRAALEPVFGRLTGISVLQIAHPVRADSGQLKFVLLSSLNLQKFAHDAQRLLPKAEIVIADAAGAVLVWLPADELRAPPGASIAGTDLFALSAAGPGGSSAVVADADGTVRIWAAADPAKVRDAGVRIFVGMAKESLVAPANARFYDDLRTLSISSGLLFVGVWILAELGIRRPVGRISAAAARLGQGDFSTRIPMRYPKGELGDLMAVLNATAEALERKRDAIDALNRMLRQSQKLEMIGQLTGGIAHDFNNLLTVILGNAEMMSAGAGGDARLRVAAAATIQAAERGAELTKRLLAFARRQPLEPTAIDVNRQIADMGDLLIRALGEGIELKIVPADGVWHALADPGQVESAVLNLCVNARDAMPHGGRLTLETKNVVLDAAYAARQSEVLPGQYVMIAVSDSGTGMDADTLERAFEPFFTTKEVGKGSGLGLSMVYGFAKQSGGHVRIYSEPGQGTTVRLYLPRVEAGAAAGLPAPKPPPSRRGTEKILVVEDDELVRASVCGQLAALDYRIVAAGDGPAALEILARDADFDLMFTDIVIPGDCDGFELAGRARKLRPGLPVLFTSGYTENALQHTSRLDLGADFIQKPYRQSELAEKIRAVLGQT